MTLSEKFSATESRKRPGSDWLVGAVDGHIHACPHINGRSLDVLQAMREAASAGMSAIGLMDNFANSSGLAALARRELHGLGVNVFGGLIMEPPAGGVSAACVRVALDYGYDPQDGAKFISFPTHHTRYTARLEGRSQSYQEGCFFVPENGEPADEVLRILDLVAAADVVLNVGHISSVEAINLVRIARRRGVNRVLVPANYFDESAISELCSLGATIEFSFFFISHATQAGLTHVDAEKHKMTRVNPEDMTRLIMSVDAKQVILSSDCGVYLLPPPVEGLREFLLILASCGVPSESLQLMVRENPLALFGL